MEQQPSADAQRILIVDDSLRARLLVETLLRAQGYKDLTSVDSAREAFLTLSLGAPPGLESAGYNRRPTQEDSEPLLKRISDVLEGVSRVSAFKP